MWEWIISLTVLCGIIAWFIKVMDRARRRYAEQMEEEKATNIFIKYKENDQWQN